MIAYNALREEDDIFSVRTARLRIHQHKAGAKLEAVEYRSRAQANDELRTRLKVLDSCLTHSLDSTQSTRSNFEF